MNDIKEKEPYTKIPNELLITLARAALCDYEHRIILAIILKTYRYQNVGKKNWRYDYIAISQIMSLTGIAKKQYVSKILIRLKQRKIVIKVPGRKIGLNTNFSEWIMSYRDMTLNSNMDILQKSHDGITDVIRTYDRSNIGIAPHNYKTLQKEKEIPESLNAEEAKKRIEKILLKSKGIAGLGEIIKKGF